MILIVGAGISGLFLGYNLYKKGIKFIILDKQSIGGKINSLYCKNGIIETAPSVIHENQDNIISLCNELGIKLKYTDSNFYSYDKLVDVKTLNHIEDRDRDYQVRDILSPQDSSTFRESEYMLFNDWLDCVKNEGKYMYLPQGFLKLISKLYKILEKNIFKGELIKVYNRQSETLPIMVDILSNGIVKKSTFYKIIFCTTMSQLYNINFEKQLLPKIQYTKKMESLRVYVILDKPVKSLNSIFKYNVIYKKEFGLTIVISDYIVLLVYTDGNHALEMSKKINEVAKFYGLDKNIKEVKTYLYKDAFDVITSKKDLNIKLENRIYQSAFPDRKNQCWLEGNLVRCKEILDCIV